MAELDALAAHLRASTKPLLVCTGAGVSLASGIPTFRGTDPGAVWAADVTEMGTNRFFRHNPAESWRWYLSRFDGLSAKAPNAGHVALAELERWKRTNKLLRNYLLVTQNVDGLHRKAGSQSLVEIHGRADRVRCSRSGCENGAPNGSLGRAEVDFEPFLADATEANVPRCPACNAYLRPHVLWFDEYYTEHAEYGYASAIGAASQVGVLIFAGTSFSVGITASLLEIAHDRGIPTWNLDPAGEKPAPFVQTIAERSEEALPALVAMLSPC